MIGIGNAHLLEAQFGRWPDFHGAEVAGIRLFTLRGRPAQLELDIEVVELVRDAGGVYRDRQRCLTTFGFANVLGARMDSLRALRQDTGLHGLEVVERGGSGASTTAEDANDWGARRYRVRLIPPPDIAEARFFCDHATILKVLSISRAI